MWEYFFQNAGREGIVLNCGKSRSVIGLLNRIFRNFTDKPKGSGSSVKMAVSKSGVTT